MDKRKRYTAEEKIKIFREVLEDGRSISAVAEKYGLSPNNIFTWRKQLFESGVRLFEINNLSLKGEVCCSLVVVRLRGSYSARYPKLDPYCVTKARERRKQVKPFNMP
jgi:transposase-like protein